MTPHPAVEQMIDALNAEGLPYMLVGSLSSMFYGIPRSTVDADFVIQVGDKPLRAVVSRLSPDFRLNPQMQFETATGTVKNVLTIQNTDFIVELFRLSSDAHDLSRFQRRLKVNYFGREVWLPTAEDVILTKARWMRNKDHDDIRDVISVQGKRLDWNYIDHWAAQHGTIETLHKIRESAPHLDDE